MRNRAGPAGSGRLWAAVALTFVAGGTLGWVGFRALMDRERSVETHYTATTVLVRDRVIAELARLESELGAHFARAAEGFADRAAARAWLARLPSERPWIGDPVLIDRAGGLLAIDLDAGWRSRDSPSASDPPFTALLADAEAAEFVRGNLTDALRHYRAASARADSTPARVLAHMRVGRVLYKLGRIDEALDHYRIVVEIGGDLLDPRGIPYAVGARRQIVDGLGALGRIEERQRVERQLRDYIVQHPWDLADGYEYELAQVLALDGGAGKGADDRIRRLQDSLARVDSIRREVLPQVLADLRGGGSAAPSRRVVERPNGDRAIVGWLVTPPDRQPSAALAYELRAAHLTGPLLRDVLKTVDLGRDVTVRMLDGGPPAGADRDGTSPGPALVEAGLDALPGWRVGLFHRRGRTIQELVARERVIYGTLIGGMVLVLLAGLAFTARASAREAELARLRTDFVASVSHELKTPLALIRMFAETLDSGITADEPQRREFYGVIRRESDRLAHLIENVLDVARIEAGTKQYGLQAADLAQVAREAVEAYRPFFERQGFHVETALPGDPVCLRLDRDAVLQALINLFHNAIKYSPDERRVTVSLTAHEGEVRLSVADSGIGIAGDEIPRIFDKYYRVRAQTSGAPAGSGLGLSLVAHTMRAHGGRVDVASAPGAGSTFTLVFPVDVTRASGRTACHES